MVTRPAVVGVVAAAAFSTAAFGEPCVQRAVAADTPTGLSCAAGDELLNASVDAPHAVMTAVAVVPDGQAAAETPGADFTSLIDISEPTTGAAENAEIFSNDGIKMTNLQATMTANKYVASPFAPAPPLHVTDDLSFYGPAYLSVKAMSPLPKKRPPSVVGVGLVTAPSQNAKKSDAAAGSGVAQPNSPTPDRK
jgi:hypothetical protein